MRACVWRGGGFAALLGRGHDELGSEDGQYAPETLGPLRLWTAQCNMCAHVYIINIIQHYKYSIWCEDGQYAPETLGPLWTAQCNMYYIA